MSEGRCGHSPGMTQKEASRLRNKLGVQEKRLKFGFEGHTIWTMGCPQLEVWDKTEKGPRTSKPIQT